MQIKTFLFEEMSLELLPSDTLLCIFCVSVGDPDLDPEPDPQDPHVLELMDPDPDPYPLVRGADPDLAPDPSLFS